MPNTSTALYLKASKRRADGSAPIYVRVTRNRKTSLVSTGVYVEPKDWNKDKGRIRASHDIADTLNDQLRRKMNAVREAAVSSPTAKRVKATVDGPKGSVAAYLDRYIAALEAKGERSFWEVRKFKGLAGKLRAALGPGLSWGELDREALTEFERHLREVCKNSVNTSRKELSRLGRVVKEAVRDGEIASSDDPFHSYRMPKRQPVERRKLTLGDIQTLGELGSEDGLNPSTFDEMVRDAFVFSFFCSGMRFGDVCRLKSAEIQDGCAVYRAMKSDKAMRTPLPPPALAIVGRYAETARDRGGFLFPFLQDGDESDGIRLRRRINSRNSQANASLKRVAEKAGIQSEGLSFHCSRHSFADHARRHSEDLYAVSKALGHSDLQTTQTYLASFDRDAVDKLNDQIW